MNSSRPIASDHSIFTHVGFKDSEVFTPRGKKTFADLPFTHIVASHNSLSVAGNRDRTEGKRIDPKPYVLGQDRIDRIATESIKSSLSGDRGRKKFQSAGSGLQDILGGTVRRKTPVQNWRSSVRIVLKS